MLFSIVMPTYRTDSEVLRKAIGSVQRQNEPDWELIVVDDNEKGGPFKREFERIRSEFGGDARIQFIVHDDNYGANKARNTAIAAARGEYLAFLDADDFWDEGYLSMVRGRISETNASLVSTPIRIFNGRGYRVMGRSSGVGNYFYEELCGDIMSPSSGVCVRKNDLIAAGGFDESLPARQDYDMWLRIMQNGDVAFCPEAGVTVVRDGHESISSGYERHLRGTEAIIKKIEEWDNLPLAVKKEAVRAQRKYLLKFLALKGQKGLAKGQLDLLSNEAQVKDRVLVALSPVLPRLRRCICHLAYQ